MNNTKYLIPGVNFLHSHPEDEKANNIDNDHVIIDEKDWISILDMFHRNPELITYIGSEQKLKYDFNTNKLRYIDK
jgi:hypothetical protein